MDGHLGTIRTVKHRIELNDPDERPVHYALYGAGPAARQFEKVEVEKITKMGVLEPDQTEWASPIVFAPENYGALIFCVEYRKRNSLTVTDPYPIRGMDKCMDYLEKATVFSILEANYGYWQIEIDDRAKDKSSFT